MQHFIIKIYDYMFVFIRFDTLSNTLFYNWFCFAGEWIFLSRLVFSFDHYWNFLWSVWSLALRRPH